MIAAVFILSGVSIALSTYSVVTLARSNRRLRRALANRDGA